MVILRKNKQTTRWKKNLLLGLTILALLLPLATAADYTIVLKDTNYEKTDTKVVGQNTITYYTIHVILTNQGTEESDNITVELLEDEIPVTEESRILPGESKVFTFTNYPSNLGNITVNYYPTNASIDRTNSNSGTKQIIISTEPAASESTPFINMAVFLIIIALVTFILKKEKN